MNKHAISIKWSDEDGGYIATIPGVHTLSAFGSTREEALSEVQIASKAYFDVMRKAGKMIPPESRIIPFSGQIRLRMPKSLHAALSFEAEEEGVSLNTYMVTLLSERYIEKKLLNKISTLERTLESIHSSFTSDMYKANRQPHRAEEKKKRYHSKKK